MSKILDAYYAGLIDGEGCIAAYPTGPGGSPKPRLRVAMTDEKVILNLRDYFGLGNVYGYQPKRPNSKYVWHWTVMNANCREVLEKILPYLQVKKEIAERVLALPVHLRGKSLKREGIIAAKPVYNTK